MLGLIVDHIKIQFYFQNMKNKHLHKSDYFFDKAMQI